MSALETPSELLLTALFADAGRAESAVESLWRRGFDPDRLSLLAREPGRTDEEAPASAADWQKQRAVSPHLWFRFQRSAIVRLAHLGLTVALGPLADELSEGPASRRGAKRLPLALRRLGLAEDEEPRFERALRDGLVLLVAAVPRGEAHEWAALLQVGGATSLAAHLRLEPWPRARRARGPRATARAHASHHDVVT
jgi:hypothetical protein